jgi:hypothetical protein
MPELDTPDDVFTSLLELLFGSDSIVVLAFVILAFIVSWYGFLRNLRDRAAAATGLLSRMHARALRYAACLMLAVQALYLAGSYVVGIEISTFAGQRPGVPVVDPGTWVRIATDSSWDAVSGTYFVAAFLLVVLAIYLESKNRSAGVLHWVSTPGWLGVAVVAIAGCAAGVTDTAPIGPYLALVGVFVAYLVLFHLAVTSPRWLANALREDPTRTAGW